MKGKMIKKILKWLGIIFGMAAAMWALLFGGMYLLVYLAFDDADAPYEPRPDGYWQRVISEEILLDVQDAEVIYEMDTHGGFHGDGETVVFLQPDGERMAEELAGNARWKSLPMPKGLEREVGGFGNIASSVEEGYYFFMNRQSESEDIFDLEELWAGYSVNYTIAIYDSAENVLYFLERDT